jgi:hypothetical protein
MAKVSICERFSANMSLAVGMKLQVIFVSCTPRFKIETSCTARSMCEILTTLWAGNMKLRHPSPYTKIPRTISSHSEISHIPFSRSEAPHNFLSQGDIS